MLNLKDNSVVIEKGEDIQQRTYKALKKLAPELPKPGAKILIKPNFVEPKPPESGAITRPEIIEGILQFLADKYKVWVGESSANWKTWQAFELAGYFNLKKKYNLELVNFDEGKYVKIKTGEKFWPEIEVAELATQVDYVISAAVLKEHPYVVTLSLKNMMGILRPKKSLAHAGANKYYIHKEYHKKEIWAKRLCLLLKNIKLDLGIIDGTTAMYGSHLNGRLEKKDLTLVGAPLAVDLAGAEILGHKKVFYLETIQQEIKKD